MVTDPRYISIQDYSYVLPPERIAAYPLEKRDASKLLVYKEPQMQTSIYRDLAEHLPDNALLVFNNTKVIEARLLFQKPSGGTIEIFCLEPGKQYSDISTALQQKGSVEWQCLVGGASKWKNGQVLEKTFSFSGKQITLNASIAGKNADTFVILLEWSDPEMSFAELLHQAGAVPLPPYIKRKAEQSDSVRYQTIYAAHDGSVAAPTAGLHFTRDIFSSLKAKHIQTLEITLHVGAGTFKPVKSETMQDHEMHAEWIDVPVDFIENLADSLDKKVVAVGTTSMRTLESLYWLGVKYATLEDGSFSGKMEDTPGLHQWEAYELSAKEMPVKAALKALAQWLHTYKMERLITQTQLMIAPGYPFKIVDGLITNFHQPQSTLLLLVSAFIGEDWKRLYDHALENDFRFLSYGDGSLLWRSA